jgi:hypothetical protein
MNKIEKIDFEDRIGFKFYFFDQDNKYILLNLMGVMLTCSDFMYIYSRKLTLFLRDTK